MLRYEMSSTYVSVHVHRFFWPGKFFCAKPNKKHRYCRLRRHPSATLAAGAQFAASGWKQFWWGQHWRREWLQPVTFPLFDIDTTAGGLTPIKRGGGHQTKSLRLLSKDGKEYLLRTIDKDLELLIPEVFKGSVVNDIVNDQISTAHHYGPLAIAKLAGVIGSLHTNPVIVFLGDEPKLGEFSSEFTNKLCLLEERPSGDGWENTAFTHYATELVNSKKLYQKLKADNDRKVDQHAFLNIRLLDMLINVGEQITVTGERWMMEGKNHLTVRTLNKQ